MVRFHKEKRFSLKERVPWRVYQNPVRLCGHLQDVLLNEVKNVLTRWIFLYFDTPSFTVHN